MPDAPSPHAEVSGQGLDRGAAGAAEGTQGPCIDAVAGWGLGFPHLYSRMRLRHVQGFLRAMDSGSALVCEDVRALRQPDQ